MIFQDSILHNDDEKEQIMRDFDVFSIEELNHEFRQQNNQELIRKVHDLFFDIKEDGDDTCFVNQLEEQYDIKHNLHEEDEEVYQSQKIISNQYLKLIPQTELQLALNYNDQYPFLNMRKKLLILSKQISLFAHHVVTNTVFEIMTIIIILFNSVMLALDDPTTEIQTDFANLMDEIFLIYYTLEAFLKIIAQGLILPKKAYLRETWNVLDFSVIITAYLPYFVTSNSLNLNSLRSFRVLRPLRTISSIKSLRMILLALFASLAQLRDAAIVLVFFYTIFAIAGVQLFSGYLKRRCFSDLGITYIGKEESDAFCADDSDCPINFICGKQIANPNSDLINFDTFGWSFLQVFVITTLEGWTDIQEAVLITFSQYVVFYFLLVVIVGAFFLVNLTLAVIKLNFKPEKIEEELKLLQEETPYYDYWELRQLDLYKIKRYKVDTKNFGITEKKSFKSQQIIRKPKKGHTVALQNINSNFKKKRDRNIRFKQIQQATYFSKPFMLQNNKVKLQGIYGMNKVDQNKLEVYQKETNSISSKTIDQGKQIQDLNDSNLKAPSNKIQTVSNCSKNGDYNEQNGNDLKIITRRKSTSQQFLNSDVRKKIYSRTVKLIPQDSKDIELLSNTEFGSIDLSELSEEQIDARMQEIAVDIEQIIPECKELSNHEQKELKITKKYEKRTKDFHLGNTNEFDEKKLKLKSKLHGLQFYPVIKIENEQFTSLEDVLESKHIKELLLQQQAQEHKIKTMMIKVQYCFKNSKKVIIGQSTANKSNSQSKQQQQKKLKVFHGLRRVKPILDDIHPIEEFLMLSELAESETKRELIEHDVDIAVSQDIVYDSHDHQRKKKKFINQKAEFTYTELQNYFTDSQDCVVDIEKNNTVIKNIDTTNVFLSYHDREAQRSVFYHEYNDIRKKDTLSNGSIIATSSIEDVLLVSDYTFFDQKFATQMNSVMKALNYDDNAYFKWIKGFTGFLLVCQRNLLHFVNSSYFEALMNLAVALNTLILALDGLISEDTSALLISFNFAFTILFTIELGLKMIAMGILDYIKDTLNIFDAIIVCLSLVELFILGGSNGKSSLSAFRAVRIFRTFRVLRVTKLMKSLQFMGFLIKVLNNSFQSLMYILLLMIIFIFIFTLLGMSFFGGQLTFTPSRQNFDDLQNSFLVVFQVLTLENWSSLLYELLLQPLSPFITIIYLVLWIMIGNYVFLNLFLAILLENFEEEYRNDKTGLDSDIQISKNLSTVQPVQQSNLLLQSTVNQTLTQNQPILRRRSQIKVTFNHDGTNQQKKEPQFVYFQEQGICLYSLFIFSQQNQFRRIIYRIVKDTKFEGCILILIFLTSVKLVFDTYIPSQGEIKQISLQLDIGFAILFGLECLMKIIAFGFAQEEASYLRESWNILDFFIVIASFVDVSISSINLSFVKILRLLRTLRPLRFITHNRSMKILVSALLQSINGIFNVGIVIILTWMMFAILGVSLMKNKLHFCNFNDENVYYYGKEECLQKNGIWDNRKTNFDNIFRGMLTLFILSTLEGWPDYMYYFIDADESGPIYDAQLQFSWFFVVFILLGAMLLINLFIGVILVNYHLAEEASRDQSLTQTQSDWIELQKLIVHSNPNMALFFPPQNYLRALIFYLIKHRFFDPFIMFIIICNIVTMGMAYDEASFQYNLILNYLNMAFTFVFIVEAILKLIALGLIGYMRNSWNQFDFFVVCASILDLILDFSGNQFMTFLKVGPQIARVFRVLRVTRLFRLVKQFQGLQKLIETAIYSLPAMLNVTALLFLVFFIYSILGVFLFQDIRNGQVINEIYNFQDFHHSFEILFRCSTGENWYKVMFDTMIDGQDYFCIYFITFIIIQQYIMLNLFILIILDQYEINYFNSDNPLNKFQEFENIFVEGWSKFAFHDKGMKMHGSYLVSFMFAMEQPLGYELKKKLEDDLLQFQNINPDCDNQQLEKFKQQLLVSSKKLVSTQVMKMNIYSDQDGYVSYHQVLYSVLKNYLHDKLNVNLTAVGARKIKKKEEETKQKINRFIHSKSDDPEKLVNPIVQYLFVSMAFKALRRYKTKRKIQQEKLAQLSIIGEYYTEGNSSDSSFERNVEVLSRKSKPSFARSEPEYGIIKYCNIPNNGIYQNDLALDNQVVSSSEDKSSKEDSDQDNSNIRRFHKISDKVEGLKRRASQKLSQKK